MKILKFKLSLLEYIIAFLAIIVLILPLGFYLYYYGGPTVSNSFDDWVAFTQFFLLFATLFNGLILFSLTLKIHNENIQLYKPVIIFKINSSTPTYTIKNIGNGPAINISIYCSSKEENWDKKINGLSLGKDQEHHLELTNLYRIGAEYYDQAGNISFSYMKDTFMRFKNIENEFNKEVKSESYIWQIK